MRLFRKLATCALGHLLLLASSGSAQVPDVDGKVFSTTVLRAFDPAVRIDARREAVRDVQVFGLSKGVVSGLIGVLKDKDGGLRDQAFFSLSMLSNYPFGRMEPSKFVLGSDTISSLVKGIEDKEIKDIRDRITLVKLIWTTGAWFEEPLKESCLRFEDY